MAIYRPLRHRTNPRINEEDSILFVWLNVMSDLTTRLAPHFLRVGRAIHRRSPGYDSKGFENEPCPACGASEGLVMHGVLWPKLVLQWGLTPAWANWVDQREGLRCCSCRSNLRSRQLAKTIVDAMNARFGTRAETLDEICNTVEMQSCEIAEINAAGDLHAFLKRLKGLSYSEYGSTVSGVRSEDLLNLSYANESFDLVVNSDVLEHVPDVGRALSEIYRVLKPSGLYIFTVPVIWNQARSRRRAQISDGQLEHILPPSFHGCEADGKNDFLVFNEFGRDFVQTCEGSGFDVKLIKDRRNPSLITFLASKQT